MVVRRIKDRWHNSTPENDRRQVLNEKTLEDQASALAFIIWRQGLNGAINLHAEDFRYDDDHQRVGVISELLAFQIQLADRLSHSFLSDDERSTLITALCGRVADQIQDNLSDIAGPGEYRPPFIALLNRRFEDYSRFSSSGPAPGYESLRYLGNQVLQLMGEDQTNRWVMDQVIDIDAPGIAKQLSRSLFRLFGWEQPDAQ